MTSYALIKAEFMHPASRGQMLTLGKSLSGPHFFAFWVRKGEIFVNAILLHGHYLRVRDISFHTHSTDKLHHTVENSPYSLLSVRSHLLQLPQGEGDCGGGGKIMLPVFS